MKSRPEKNEALTAATDRASSVKNQATKQGIDMTNSTALTIAGRAVRQMNGLYSLNDLHKVSGGEEKHQPAFFARREETQALIAEICSADSQIKALETVRGRGKAQGTYACKELVIAYAAWISAAFHLKVIRVFLDAVQPANPAIDYTRISPAQAQDLREIVKAIVDAKIQGHGETWARLQNKFRVNSYLQLPASCYEEARAYLISKLPNGYAGAVYEENVPLERLDAALAAANTVAMQVQHAALMSMMKSEDLRRGRWMVSFGYGSDAAPSVKQIDGNVCVLPVEKFHSAIEDSLSVDPQVLMQLATTCMSKMARMAAHSTKDLSA